jgi:hypothetical protein
MTVVSSPRERVLALVLLVVAAWISAGAAPLVGAAGGALTPIDFVRDYVAADARVHFGRGAPPAGEAGNARAVALGAPRVVLLDGPYHLHPPPALLPVLPLVPLGFGGAALAWVAISFVALGVLAFVLVALVATPKPRGTSWAVGAFSLLVLWPPVLHNLEKGQWSILLAALVALGFHALEQRRPRAAGVWLGLAASFKATPILLLAFLALRHRRAAWSMGATLATAGLASLAVGGIAPWSRWIADAPRDVAAWQTWGANTASLNGLLARLLAGGSFARPMVASPMLARAVNVVLSLGLLALLGIVTKRAPATPQNERRLFAGWVALVVVLNPLAWTHTAILALVPIALLAKDNPIMAATAFLVLTVPRETLAALAGPLPVSPGRGLVLSLHASALFLLFAVSVWTTDSAPPRDHLSTPARDLERSPARP